MIRGWSGVGRPLTRALLPFFLFGPGALRAEITIPDDGTYVIDRANIISDSDETLLEGWLRELYQRGGGQVKVLTVETTGGEDVFGFFHRHAEEWKLGKQGKDDGVLIGVAMKERQIRIHTGYGVEGILPDSWCGAVARDVFAAKIKQSRASEGIVQGTSAVIQRLAESAHIPLTGGGTGSGVLSYRYNRRPGGGAGAAIGVCAFFPLLFFVVMLVVISRLARRGRYYRTWSGGGF